jgi:hypothetical protein
VHFVDEKDSRNELRDALVDVLVDHLRQQQQPALASISVKQEFKGCAYIEMASISIKTRTYIYVVQHKIHT